jgi:ribonuclease I
MGMGKDWCVADLDIAQQMRSGTYLNLATAMPGVHSCLYNHEWYAHGTCSGLSVNSYFRKAAKLADRFLALKNFNQLIEHSQGGSVSRADLLNALKADLGPKSDEAAVLLCRIDRQTQKAYFSEVDLTLKREAFMAFPAERSLGVSKPHLGPNGAAVRDQGNCPEEGIGITPAGRTGIQVSGH